MAATATETVVAPRELNFGWEQSHGQHSVRGWCDFVKTKSEWKFPDKLIRAEELLRAAQAKWQSHNCFTFCFSVINDTPRETLCYIGSDNRMRSVAVDDVEMLSPHIACSMMPWLLVYFPTTAELPTNEE